MSIGVHTMSAGAFVCPQCKGVLARDASSFRCAHCNELFAFQDGIVYFMTRGVRAAVAPFLAQYKAVRDADGRGADHAAYYLSLPDAPSHEWRMRARSFRVLMTLVGKWRAGREAGAMRVLDVGAGNCWLRRRFAERRFDTTAVDIFDDARDGMRAGAHYLRDGGVEFDRVAAHFDALPFADASFDVIVFNASLHYSHDQLATLRESLRLLRSGGVVFVLDSPQYRSAASGNRMIASFRPHIARIVGSEEGIVQSSFLLTADFARWERALGVRIRRTHVPYGLRQFARKALTRFTQRREPATMDLLMISRERS